MQRMESNPRIGTTSGKPWFVHPQSGALVPRGLRRRDVGRHDQVLPGRLLQGDRRLRAPGHVGRHRLPPRPHARLDRRERRSRAHSLRAPAPAGRQPQGHLDRTAARRLRPVLHGHLAALLSGGGDLPPAGAPGADRQRRHAVGLPPELAQGPAALRRPRVQAIPPLLPACLPAHGQARRHRAGRGRAGASLACQPPGAAATRRPTKRRQRAELLGLSLRHRDHGCGGRPVPRAVPRTARLPHDHHGQRLASVHDAPRSGAGIGLPGGSPHRGRRHVGGLGAAGLGPAGARAGRGRRPDGAPAGRGRRASAARLFPRRQARGGLDARGAEPRPSIPASRSPASATAISARTIIRASSRRSAPAGPHMLFVGMPTPFKETWCERHRERLRGARHHGRGRQLRRARRLHQARAALGPVSWAWSGSGGS